jgi:hypothetical protein
MGCKIDSSGSFCGFFEIVPSAPAMSRQEFSIFHKKISQNFSTLSAEAYPV